MPDSTASTPHIRLDAAPHPLRAGEILADRFEIQRSLGRGGFGIAYLAKDRRRNDEVVVKELAPAGLHRSDGVLQLESLGHDLAHRLRQRFLEEARVLGRLNVRGVPSVRARFSERGTAYFVTQFYPGAVTLEQLLARSGRLDVDGALDILYQLLETLEGIHAEGVIHRDIKPANILVLKNGDTELIDFGAAREWHADVTLHHTVLFTPGYAPLEQMSERGKRGPASDIYSLSATIYQCLTGIVPPSAAERAMGSVFVPIRSLRPQVEPGVARALESGLALKAEDRPHTIEAFRETLAQPDESAADSPLETFDARLLEIQRLSIERRECPSCGDVLEDPKPLKTGTCPVCHEGTISKSEFNPRLCPSCTAGTLKRFDNADPLHVCPQCSIGWLRKRRKSMLGRDVWIDCPDCGATFHPEPEGWRLESQAEATEDLVIATCEEWRLRSGRSAAVWRCDGCGAQYDGLSDGRMKQVVPPPTGKYSILHPEEWARVAAGHAPGCGNAFCSSCDADFFVDGQQATLLAAHEDPSGFAAEHLGRLLTWDDLRWLGVGKESPHRGIVCNNCKTEFDREGIYLRLVRTHHKRMRKQIGLPHTLEDWHRIAKGLPQVHEESEFLERFDAVLIHAYREGVVEFDSKREAVWRSSATKVGDEKHPSTLSVTREEIAFGGVLRKWKVPMDAVVTASGDDRVLTLSLSGQAETVGFEVEEAQLSAKLPSGTRTVILGPDDLAARIRHEIANPAPTVIDHSG